MNHGCVYVKLVTTLADSTPVVALTERTFTAPLYALPPTIANDTAITTRSTMKQSGVPDKLQRR